VVEELRKPTHVVLWAIRPRKCPIAGGQALTRIVRTQHDGQIMSGMYQNGASSAAPGPYDGSMTTYNVYFLSQFSKAVLVD
jgi:hypothetical protein